MTKKENTLELVQKAMMGTDYSYDIYFRMAVIDEYLNGHDSIWELYSKMQRTRCGEIKEISEDMIEHEEAFKKLIDSFKDEGFNEEYPLVVNRDGIVIDGAHRLACALYFSVDEVTTYTNNQYYFFYPAVYNQEWFINHELEKCIEYADKFKKIVEERIEKANVQR